MEKDIENVTGQAGTNRKTYLSELQKVRDASKAVQTKVNDANQELQRNQTESIIAYRALETQTNNLSRAFQYTLVAFLQRPAWHRRIRCLHEGIANQSSQIQLLQLDHQTRLRAALRELDQAKHSLLDETKKRSGYERYVAAISRSNHTAASRTEHLESTIREQRAASERNSILLSEAAKQQSLMQQHIKCLQQQVLQIKEETLHAKQRATIRQRRIKQSTRPILRSFEMILMPVIKSQGTTWNESLQKGRET